MKNNKLIPYKENIFTKISNFFKKIFNKKTILEREEDKAIYTDVSKENFIENILIKENEEEKRLKKLQIKYDNGEINEEDISEEDIEKLIDLYKKETEELNIDTEIRKEHIKQMFKELKK